jgi:RNA polymerase sigma-70 factor (ECF subfamily)
MEPAVEESEGSLILRAREGGLPVEEALVRIYDRHKDAVHGFLLRFLADRELAEDALQESFYRLYRGLDLYDASRPFKPWLHQVVRNTALDLLRGRAKERAQRSGGAAGKEDAPGPLAEAERTEEIGSAREALASLPDDARALLLERHGLGLKLEELAVSWSLTERSIRSRLDAAVSELTRSLIRLRSRKGGRP